MTLTRIHGGVGGRTRTQTLFFCSHDQNHYALLFNQNENQTERTPKRNKNLKEQPELFQQHPLFWSAPVLKLEDLGVFQCDILGKDTFDTKSSGYFI